MTSSSPSTSPRGSDLSFASVPSTFSSPTTTPTVSPPASTPPAVRPRPYASTSTISHSSTRSLSPHLREPTSTSRLPKARVFVDRRPQSPPATSPDRPRANSAHTRTLPVSRSVAPAPSANTPTSPTLKHEPRCVSDLHEAFRAHRGAAWTPLLQPPLPPHNDAHIPSTLALSDEARRCIAEDDNAVPSWVPDDEKLDWTPTVDFELDPDEDDDPCEEEENRWVGSLRNLSQLGTLAGRREKPAIRGSVLEIRPPTVRERLGVHGRRKRGWDIRTERITVEERADEYVGFLVRGDTDKGKKGRKTRSFLRFLRRVL